MQEALAILTQTGENGIIAIAVWQGFKFMQNNNENLPLYSKVFGWAIALGGWLFVVYMIKEIFFQ